MLQDQIYCFNYLIAQKHYTQTSQDEILLLFRNILTSCAKSNTRVAMGMTPSCSAQYELVLRVLFYLLNN